MAAREGGHAYDSRECWRVHSLHCANKA
jgi:hypothetical protein